MERFKPKILPSQVRTTTSEIVPMIERNLNTIYDYRPTEVVMDLRNRIILYTNEPKFREVYGPEFLLGVPRFLGNLGALYTPDWHSIFSWPEKTYRHPDDHFQARVHEGEHAYYYQRDADLWLFALSSIEDHPKVSCPDQADKTLIERFIVHVFSSEGFAEWTAKETLKREYWEYARNGDEDKLRRARYREGRTQEEASKVSSYYLKQQVSEIEEAKRGIAEALCYEGAKRQRKGGKAKQILRRLNYDIAPMFVGIVMDSLIGSGLTVDEAINLYISKTPTQLLQLENIPDYIQSLQ